MYTPPISSTSLSFIKEAITLCEKLEAIYSDSVDQKNALYRFHQWVFDTTIANMHYMREDLSERFNGRQFTIKNKCSSVNGMIMPSDHGKSNRIIILCNANGDYYEYLYYQNKWIIPFFTSKGIDVAVWNYREYGKSRGVISPANLKSDGICVVKHIKELGYTKIGVFGHSLGGDIACTLVNKCNLDFLFADRTYGNLVSISRNKLPYELSYIVEKITGWSSSPYKDYSLSTAYNVMTNDCDDEMINDQCSLKSLVAWYSVLSFY
jgi:hypothetical protein